MDDLVAITVEANKFWLKHYYAWVTQFSYWLMEDLVDLDVTKMYWR